MPVGAVCTAVWRAARWFGLRSRLLGGHTEPKNGSMNCIARLRCWRHTSAQGRILPSKDFWRVFFSDRRPSTALSDVTAWTEYFGALLGTAPAPLLLAPPDAFVKQQLFSVSFKGTQADMSDLIAPISVEEAKWCIALPTGRAPDMQGLTGGDYVELRLTTRLPGMGVLCPLLLLSVPVGCCNPCCQTHVLLSLCVLASWSQLPRPRLLRSCVIWTCTGASLYLSSSHDR